MLLSTYCSFPFRRRWGSINAKSPMEIEDQRFSNANSKLSH
ncbi:hypothetical protein LLB_2754 [Legionella longbeachae D-4968]|nr:hypothetical protein LLB_2754 [Legionella longbeachae D-4968]